MSHASVEIVFRHRDTEWHTRCERLRRFLSTDPHTGLKALAFHKSGRTAEAVPFPCRPLTLVHLNPIR
jgi:hypothetical protein